jgi:hypothetical protein
MLSKLPKLPKFNKDKTLDSAMLVLSSKEKESVVKTVGVHLVTQTVNVSTEKEND